MPTLAGLPAPTLSTDCPCQPTGKPAHRRRCSGDIARSGHVSVGIQLTRCLCRRTGACFTIRCVTATSDRARRLARRNHWGRSSPARGLQGVRAEVLRRPKRLRRLPPAAPMPSSPANHHRVSNWHDAARVLVKADGVQLRVLGKIASAHMGHAQRRHVSVQTELHRPSEPASTATGSVPQRVSRAGLNFIHIAEHGRQVLC